MENINIYIYFQIAWVSFPLYLNKYLHSFKYNKFMCNNYNTICIIIIYKFIIFEYKYLFKYNGKQIYIYITIIY